MRKVAFLDRDGVINKEIGTYVCHKSDFELLPHAVANCKRLINMGYELILVTNQGGIAKNLYTIEELEEMHQIIFDAFNKAKIPILETYFCPHHSIVANCLCRKPKSLMIEKGLHKYQLKAENCLLIGDNQRDIDAANAAGLEMSFLIKSNDDWAFILDSIPQAVSN